MKTIWFYTLLSVFGISLISLIGVFTLAINKEKLKTWLLSLVSFSAGALLGDVFLHILPEMSENGWPENASLYLLLGIVIFFILEKFVFWHHSHSEHEETIHSYTYVSLISDGLHNLIDGMIIAVAFLTDIKLGVATTLAVIFHEIPQEIGNFAVLLHGGLSKAKALLYNFISAIFAILGALIILFIFKSGEVSIPSSLLAFSASSFIYLAMSDLIPELHKEKNIKSSGKHLLFFSIGILLMFLLTILE